MRERSILKFFLTANIKLRMTDDQAYMFNLRPCIMIFAGSYFIMRFVLCSYIYDLTYITYIMYKQIHYFVSCEIADVTMATMSMNIICSN